MLCDTVVPGGHNNDGCVWKPIQAACHPGDLRGDDLQLAERTTGLEQFMLAAEGTLLGLTV